MNKLCVLAVFALASVFAGAVQAGVEVGDQGPSFEFDKSWNMPEGVTNLEGLRGQIIMVERWATT